MAPQVGWRVWNVVERDGELRLASLVYHEVWTPGEELAARCRRTLAALPWGRPALHEPPAFDCCCGIYAVQSPARAAGYLRSDAAGAGRAVHRVLGSVALWGRIVEADEGWRGAYAYPETIVVPSRRWSRVVSAALWPYRPSPRVVAEELAAYGVPVRVADELGAPRRGRAGARVAAG